jgi:hypothetical protein
MESPPPTPPSTDGTGPGARAAGVDLFWLPLGAGGSSVRFNGRVFEGVQARLERRRPLDLYHTALEVRFEGAVFVIEMTPIPDARGQARGVVVEGPVGARWAARFRIFRYEIRCWRGGAIPDVDEAVASPLRLSDDPLIARRIIELAPQVPPATWGRDELEGGEMWNSNSVVAWLLERAGLPAGAILPPGGGRAPGWRSGIVVARRASPREPHRPMLLTR